MTLIIYNASNIGLNISKECLEAYLMKKKNKGEIEWFRIGWKNSPIKIVADGHLFYIDDIPRHDLDLVACIEELGPKMASCNGSELRIMATKCEEYRIIKNRGYESIEILEDC